MEDDGLAPHFLQLGDGASMVAGFAQGHVLQVCHLVRADDVGAWKARGNRARLGQGQSTSERARQFAGQGCFVDLG